MLSRKSWTRSANNKYSSDAEAGVLADYVAALVAVDETEANVRRSCIESLEDFLGKDSKQQSDNVAHAGRAGH